MLCLLFSLLGCGGGSSESSGSGTAHPIANEANRWAQLSFAERHELMTFTVHPTLAVRFQQYYGTDSATLACITCHGRDAEEVAYQMPNGLPTLDPEAIPDTDEARFMAEVVTAVADRTMRAGGTITCFTCHPSSAGSVQ